MVDHKKELFKRYLYNSNKKLEIYRTGVYEDKNRNFWITSRDGLLRFNKDAGSIKRFTYDPSNPKSLNTNYLKSLCPDPEQPDDFLWIGTAGGGLNKFDISRETFSHFTIKQGLPNNVVYGILPDKNGNLWLSTNKGLSKFNPEKLTFKNYDVSDGLQSDEFNTGAYFKSSSGELFFGGIIGMKLRTAKSFLKL
jgi:ligand-binding sensor domain-containing protein